MEPWIACKRVLELEIAKHWMVAAAGCLCVASWLTPTACVGLLGVAVDAMHVFSSEACGLYSCVVQRSLQSSHQNVRSGCQRFPLVLLVHTHLHSSTSTTFEGICLSGLQSMAMCYLFGPG
jgi:hypothetical protein